MHYYVWYGKNNNIAAYLQTANFCAEPAVDVGEEAFQKLGLYSERPSNVSGGSIADLIDSILAHI